MGIFRREAKAAGEDLPDLGLAVLSERCVSLVIGDPPVKVVVKSPPVGRFLGALEEVQRSLEAALKEAPALLARAEKAIAAGQAQDVAGIVEALVLLPKELAVTVIGAIAHVLGLDRALLLDEEGGPDLVDLERLALAVLQVSRFDLLRRYFFEIRRVWERASSADGSGGARIEKVGLG